MESRFIVESAVKIFQYVVNAGGGRVIVHPRVQRKLVVDPEMNHKKSIENPTKVSSNNRNIRINSAQKVAIKNS